MKYRSYYIQVTLAALLTSIFLRMLATGVPAFTGWAHMAIENVALAIVLVVTAFILPKTAGAKRWALPPIFAAMALLQITSNILVFRLVYVQKFNGADLPLNYDGMLTTAVMQAGLALVFNLIVFWALPNFWPWQRQPND